MAHIELGPPNHPVQVRLVDCLGWLSKLRSLLLDALRLRGVEVDLTYEPWAPHISVGNYAGPNQLATPFCVEGLALVGGKQLTCFEWRFL